MDYFNIALPAWCAAALLIYMTLVFIIAYVRKRLDTVDSAWGGAFVVIAAMTAGLELTVASIVILVLVNIWAIRLTSHLINRSRQHDKDDPRYIELATKWGKQNYWPRAYLSIFLTQGLLALVVGLPIITAAGDAVSWSTPIIAAGVFVWTLGFVIEMLADNQLRTFLADKSNKGKLLDKGLWAYSRHPNYLGELTQWYGIAIVASSTYLGWIGFVGPVVLTILIRFISGVPPIERRKKQDKAYQKYMQRTGAILPKIRRT